MCNINKKKIIVFLMMISVLFTTACDQNIGKRTIEKQEKIKKNE